MMDVSLIYFSQTGNTRKVAMAMADVLSEAGHSTITVPLREATSEDAARSDLLGVGTPCYSSQAPTPIKTYLRALPPLKNQRAFVFATSSGSPGKVLYDLTRLLRDKSAHVLGGYIARGEVHHPAPHMKGQFPSRPSNEDLARARRFAIAVAKHASAGHASPLLEFRTDFIKPSWGFYYLVGLASSDKMLRLLMPEPKPVPGNCDQCNWCVDQCPLDNITLNPYPILGDRCIRCYRCLAGCPQDVFEANWRFADPLLQLLYNRFFMHWFGDLKPGERIY